MRLLAVLLTMFACGPISAAIILGNVDDFQDGATTEGWIHGRTLGNADFPVNVNDAGPAGTGDHSLRISSRGGGGPGSRFTAFNTSNTDWQGNYTAAGVSAIQMQVNNTGSNTINLRIAIEGPGGWWMSSTPTVINAVAGWSGAISFPMTASGLSYVGGGTNDVNATLGGVTRITILSSAFGTSVGAGGFGIPKGDAIAASALIDNITAVPEPSSFFFVGLFGACGIAVRFFLKKRKQP